MDHKYFTGNKNRTAIVPKVKDAIPKTMKKWNYGLIDQNSKTAKVNAKNINPTGISLIGIGLSKNANIFSNSMNKIARAQNKAIKSNAVAKYGTVAVNNTSYSSPRSFFNSIASGANSAHDLTYNNSVIEQEDHSSVWSSIKLAKETPDHNFINGIDKDWLLIGGLVLCAIIM